MVTRRRASAIRRTDPSLEALIAEIPGMPTTSVPRQEPPKAPTGPFRGWKRDQEAWVKETGRWGR